jgi:sec-independent protein translocase protein TatB
VIGLTFEKLLIIAVIAGFLLGPERLPAAAAALARAARGAKALVGRTRVELREQLGPEFDEIDWTKLDPRRYDPRRIVRDAIAEELGAGPGVETRRGPKADEEPRDL